MPKTTNPKNSIAPALSPEAAKARQNFPRGLIQPTGSFRFSADALLLATFATPHTSRPLRGLDLGCGCGVVGFGIMLRLPAATFLGIDILPELVHAACQNAALLGLNPQYQATTGDLRQPAAIPGLDPAAFDLITANPPYRKPHSGRLPPSDLRQTALFETHSNIHTFAAAAAKALKHHGRFCCIYNAQDLPELCAALTTHRLTPKRIQPVHTRANEGARRILLEAKLNARPGLKWETPLYL